MSLRRAADLIVEAQTTVSYPILSYPILSNRILFYPPRCHPIPPVFESVQSVYLFYSVMTSVLSDSDHLVVHIHNTKTELAEPLEQYVREEQHVVGYGRAACG